MRWQMKSEKNYMNEFNNNLLKELDEIIRKNNPYTKVYQMMYEIEKKTNYIQNEIA